MKRSHRKLERMHELGATMVEAAIALPLSLMLILGIIDLSIIINRWATFTDHANLITRRVSAMGTCLRNEDLRNIEEHIRTQLRLAPENTEHSALSLELEERDLIRENEPVVRVEFRVPVECGSCKLFGAALPNTLEREFFIPLERTC